MRLLVTRITPTLLAKYKTHTSHHNNRTSPVHSPRVQKSIIPQVTRRYVSPFFMPRSRPSHIGRKNGRSKMHGKKFRFPRSEPRRGRVYAAA